MKKLTNKQAREIAKKLIPFIKSYADKWDAEEEKLTISAISDVIKNHTETVFNWVFDMQLRYIGNKTIDEEAEIILDMLRYPEWIETEVIA